MSSSLFSRVEKLENRRGTDDKVLLIWLKLSEGVDAAVLAANKAGQFGTGDLVMCVEWLGADPMPKPRWLKRRGERFSEEEDRYICAMLEKKIAMVDGLVASDEPTKIDGLAKPMPRDLSEMSSVDLMHCALGVKT
jgi:hypothetical protein